MNTIKPIKVKANRAKALTAHNDVIGFNHGISAQDRTAARDFNDWLEEQDEAEVSFLVSEFAMKNQRGLRLSAYG